MLHISTSHDAAGSGSSDCKHAFTLPPTVIYHGVFIEHAPASHLIIIMEGGAKRREAERSGVIIAPDKCPFVRSFVRPNMCA